MKASLTLIPALILLLVTPMSVPAAERYYTFMGVTGGGGSNKISYSGWVNNEQRNLDISGSYYSLGMMGLVQYGRVMGEFTVQYLVNSNSGEVDTSVKCLYLTLAAKYAYPLSQMFSLTGGAGLFADAPPATLGYEGGGGVLGTLGVMMNISFDLRLLVDLNARYGSFGLGDGSTRLGYGASAGIVYSVGRI